MSATGAYSLQHMPFPAEAAVAFATSFNAGLQKKISNRNLGLELEKKIAADAIGFATGFYSGFQGGLIAGLRSLWETLVEMFKISTAAVQSSFERALKAVQKEPLLLAKPYALALRALPLEKAQKLVASVANLLKDVAVHPQDYVVLSSEFGKHLGEEAGVFITEDFLKRSATELGAFVGDIAGQVAVEIILQIVLAVCTEGTGNAGRLMAMLGAKLKGGEKLAGLAQRLRMLILRVPGLQRFCRSIGWEEKAFVEIVEATAKPTIPKGLLSKGARPPHMQEMVDPFSGEKLGVSARAGTKRSLRTAIDASGAEFESFKQALFERAEIGIQSPGGANVAGVDFITAQRRADGMMEVLLNDATINGKKIAKTSSPASWLEEAKQALAPERLDLADTALEEEVRAAFSEGRVRVRTLQVDISPQGMVKVDGW